MGITANDITRFERMAGPAFTWDGVRGCGRPTASVREPLRADLLARQGGVCPVCGNGDNGQSWEFNHVVSRGPNVKGFIAGNIFTGHSACNLACKERGPVVQFADMARPDVIATEWTPFPILKARAGR